MGMRGSVSGLFRVATGLVWLVREGRKIRTVLERIATALETQAAATIHASGLGQMKGSFFSAYAAAVGDDTLLVDENRKLLRQTDEDYAIYEAQDLMGQLYGRILTQEEEADVAQLVNDGDLSPAWLREQLKGKRGTLR